MNLWYHRDEPENFNKLFNSNIGLAKKVANRYSHGDESLFGDLLQESLLALIVAIKVYDPSRLNEFSTFAGLIMRNKILHFLKDNPSYLEIKETDSIGNIENSVDTSMNYEMTMQAISNIQFKHKNGKTFKLDPSMMISRYQNLGYMQRIFSKIRKELNGRI